MLVASIFFGLKYQLMVTSKTITDHKAYWVIPSKNTSSLPSQKLVHIDFGSPQLKRESVENFLPFSKNFQLPQERNLLSSQIKLS